MAVGLAVLALVAAEQNRRIDQLHREAAEARRAAEAGTAATDQRVAGLDQQIKGLDTRLTALDDRSRQAFDPQAVAASALPSVFQVIAGDFSGSAFAVGKPQAGRTNILTAYHVVKSVWSQGRSDRKSTRLNSSHRPLSRMPSSAWSSDVCSSDLIGRAHV